MLWSYIQVDTLQTHDEANVMLVEPIVNEMNLPFRYVMLTYNVGTMGLIQKNMLW